MKWYSTYTRIVWAFTTVGFLYIFYRMPIEKLGEIGKLLETNGGKILVLALMAMLFFVAALGFSYYVIDAIQNHTLEPDDVMANMMTQFVTGSAFGTAIGALVSLLGANRGEKH